MAVRTYYERHVRRVLASTYRTGGEKRTEGQRKRRDVTPKLPTDENPRS
jgi:hypothetical protein